MDNLELYKKYRPKSFKQMVGQEDAVRVLQDMLARNSVPRTLLFTGPSGVGKTTLARIMQSKLECHDFDFHEKNAAESRGIDDVREWQRQMSGAPMGGKCRIWYIDEAHKLTNDAQNALLKTLEDTPRHVYFFLSTTDPVKLIKTIKTRSSEIKLSLLKDSQLKELLNRVLEREEKKASEEVVERIVEFSEGSARKALVLLHQIIGMDDDDQRLKAVMSSMDGAKGYDLAKALIVNSHVKWKEIAEMLGTIQEHEEVEGIRYLILAFANSVLLGGGNLASRAARVIRIFQYPMFDSKKAGLTLACWEVLNHEN